MYTNSDGKIRSVSYSSSQESALVFNSMGIREGLLPALAFCTPVAMVVSAGVKCCECWAEFFKMTNVAGHLTWEAHLKRRVQHFLKINCF